MSVYRIYVEKKPQFAVEAKKVCKDIKTSLQIKSINSVRVINRYDVQGLDEKNYDLANKTVFSEPALDDIFFDCPEATNIFAIEYLPGQFDQRADSCAQCVQLLVQGDRPIVKNARIYIIDGEISTKEFATIKEYLINPVESREASLDTVKTLDTNYETKTEVAVLDNFINLSNDELKKFIEEYSLAMDFDDIIFCQEYFAKTEKRNPTITEIKMIDTYWSDHCRHTTFSTNINDVIIHDDFIKQTFEEYKSAREVLYKGRTDKPITLMDLAVIGAKKLKADGLLDLIDESEEINACSVKIKVDVMGELEDWLLMFKNETHNHPTEIEPFGGAATCLGGAIRDPLSGRSYVYQAMRVTGASDPLVSIEETIKGKLSQKKIVTGAANGYSSYGNQIGLATGMVHEFYHKGYTAKRMEIGAVIGAAPAKNVIRTVPNPGDLVVLLGGKTGRDGCGGATGSSKSHTLSSLETCGAEVQKGNAPEERKIQRLFRNGEVTRLIKRCNDFGAGGVSVAIGELSDGLHINLDVVPKKYNGLDGTELAISESQERMACVIEKENLEKFISLCNDENIEATLVAEVTDDNRLSMEWCGKEIVSLSRDFLNSNGATKFTDVEIKKATVKPVNDMEITGENIIKHLSNINNCSQKGLSERFDASIGAGSVFMPFGGENQLTPVQAMVAKIPVLKGETQTASVMSYGFNPFISEQSPYHGAMYAVIESVSKVVAAGGSAKECYLTFQEYFPRTNNDKTRWGLPMAALLGAYKAQIELGIAAIGGKDSMSGTFENIDVPPTLCSFAVSVTQAKKAVSPEFKSQGNNVIMILPEYNENQTPDFESLKQVYATVEKMISDGIVNACATLTSGGVSEVIAKMSLGNQIGVKFTKGISKELMFNPVYGGFILEIDNRFKIDESLIIAKTTSKFVMVIPPSKMVDLHILQRYYEAKLEPCFPYKIEHSAKTPKIFTYKDGDKKRVTSSIKVAKPRVLIPVFPGTNCEYDTARVFERAGGEANIFVIKNLTATMLQESINAFAKEVAKSQIVMLPGGFSGGDEPDGSAKFIVSFLKNPIISQAVNDLLTKQDGLMLGICNGFQALIKLGLLPYGQIQEQTEISPTLTFNTIGRHQSMVVNTRICSNKSPWLKNTSVSEVFSVPISHGEGRFVCDDKMLRTLENNGQIATQYVDFQGQPTYDIKFNPNESYMAIEGITSADGRIFGKMGHSERIGEDIMKNISGNHNQRIFEAGVEYFTK